MELKDIFELLVNEQNQCLDAQPISIEYQPNQIVIDGLISITVMHKCVIIKHVYDINEERIIYVPMLILLMQTSDCNNNNESIFVDIILEHSRELIEMYDIHVFK